jgi:cytochrome c biogenesis protein
MTQLKDAGGQPLRLLLKPGQTAVLPGGRGSITFDSVQRWAGLSIRYDPGKAIALTGAVAALAGLTASLMIRRRRVFIRVRPVAGRSVVSIGGLAKGDDPGLAAAIDDLLTDIAHRTSTSTGSTSTGSMTTGGITTGSTSTGSITAGPTSTGSGTKGSDSKL